MFLLTVPNRGFGWRALAGSLTAAGRCQFCRSPARGGHDAGGERAARSGPPRRGSPQQGDGTVRAALLAVSVRVPSSLLARELDETVVGARLAVGLPRTGW